MTDSGVDRLFDEVVASANGAMVVVTAAVGEDRAGCLVGFHNQTSIEPRRYTVWLSKANHTYRVALLARATLLDDGGDHVASSGPPIAARVVGDFTPLRLADVRGVVPGHAAGERPGSLPDREHRGS